jgi:hypothetical protein
MALPPARNGQRVLVLRRPVPFSMWPSRPGRRHHALQSLLFARDPWLVIGQRVSRHCPKPRRAEALACLEQARDFFYAGTSAGMVAAKPLALYYSFMNLVKVYCLTRGPRTTFDLATHGLSQRLLPGGKEFTGAFVRAHPSRAGAVANNFDEFQQVLMGAGLAADTDYQLPVLVPQIVPGHRFWAQATSRTERFIALHDIAFMYDDATEAMWLNLFVVADDLTRLGVTQTRLINESRLARHFSAVACAEEIRGRPLLCLQQTVTHNCPGGYPADHFRSVVAVVRHLLWVTVATVSPYRRYYVYLAPQAEQPFVLPQLLSIYALVYYFGSITRYRPHQYDSIAAGPFGPWVHEFINGQPLQFLYLMASEFAEQDVTRPSIL